MPPTPLPSSPPSSKPNILLDLAEEDDNDVEAAQTEEETRTTQLKSALWLPLGRLVDKTTLSLNKNATPQFIGSLTELVWCQIAGAAVDVESFARHASRNVISVEDVLLLARRNDMLKGLLEDFLEEERNQEKVASNGTKKRRLAR